MLRKKYRQYFTITYYIKIEMSYQSATYNRTSGSFGIQLLGKDSSSNSTGLGEKTVVLNAPGVWMVEIYADINYTTGQLITQATLGLYENSSDLVQSIVTSATDYELVDNIYLPSKFGACFSKTYVVNAANPSWTISVSMGNVNDAQYPWAANPTGDLLMKATKLC